MRVIKYKWYRLLAKLNQHSDERLARHYMHKAKRALYGR